MVLFINPANRAPGVHTGPAPGASWGKYKKIFSETTGPRAFIFCLSQNMVVLFINPASRAPGVMGKTKKNLLLQNHKAQSFHILFVAIYSVPLYKSCQPCPWGPYGPHPGGGVMGKTLKNLLLRNYKAWSFHILCVAMYNGPLYKSCLPCPWGPYGPCPGGVMGKT